MATRFSGHLNPTETQNFIDRLYNYEVKTNLLSNMNVSQTSSNNSVNDVSKSVKVSSFLHNEMLAKDVLSKAGPESTYQKNEYSHDIGIGEPNNHNFKVSEITATNINQDVNPLKVVKPNDEKLMYKQKVSIKYLQPPTPCPPGPIIIREKQMAPTSLPPIIIRQKAPAPRTPSPLTIREKAPTPPPKTEATIIERPIPAPPAPPQQVIIERIPAPPAKPRPIIYEKWLPYKTCDRPVIIQRVKSTQSATPPKNVIIEYEKPSAVAIREVIEEGVYRVDPASYQSVKHSNGEIRYVERITELPIQSSKVLNEHNIVFKQNNNEYDSLLKNMLSPNLSISSKSNLGQSKFLENVEYETVQTSVSESIAKKLISDALAAGMIIQPTKA